MSMSPGQEVPRFQLLSVPLVRCKPPISPLIPTTQVGDIGQVGLLMMQANETAGERHVPSCHLSYPSIPQNFSLDPDGQLCDSVYSGTNPQYFNTIPLKSTPPKTSHVPTPGLIETTYRMHPPLPPDSRPEYDKIAQIIRQNLFQNPEFQCNHKSESPTCTDDYRLAGQSNNESHDEALASAPVVPMTNFSNNSSELGACSDVFDYNITNSKENINSTSGMSQIDLLEKKVDALYKRKQWLLNRLLVEEDKLYRINREEAELTGEWAMMDRLTNGQSHLNGSHASLSRLAERSSRGRGHQSVRSSGLLSRLKWRNSRRSKSAHVRLSPDGNLHENTAFRYSALENQENGNGGGADNLDTLSSSPDRQNSAHLEATMPRRLLRWWRQNKRPTNDESRRRQSVGIDEPNASGVMGCTNHSLRTRGSSVPPKEKSPAERCERNGTLSNRSSFRYKKNGPSELPKEEQVANGHQCSSMPPFPIQRETAWSHRDRQKLCMANLPQLNGACITSNGLRSSSEASKYAVKMDGEVPNSVPRTTGGHFLNPQAIALGLPGICQQFGPTPFVMRETVNPVRQPISYANYIRSLTANVRPSRWTTIRCGTGSASDSRQDPVPPPPLPPRTTVHGWNQSIPNNGFYLVPRRHHHQYQPAQIMKGVPAVLYGSSLPEKIAHASSQQPPRYDPFGSPTVIHQADTRIRSHHSYSAKIPPQWINVPGRPHTAQVLVRLERSSDQHQPITTPPQPTSTVPNPPTLLTCKTVARDNVLTGKQIKIPCLPDFQKMAIDNWRPVPKGTNDFIPIISSQPVDVATTLQGQNRRPVYPQSNGKISGFTNDVHRPIPIIPLAISSASGPSSATRVKTAQECNEALRECLKGWELTVDPEPLNNPAARAATDSHKTWTLVIPETSRRPINLAMPQVVVQTRFHPIGRNTHLHRGRVREGGSHNGQCVYSNSANTRKQWPSAQRGP